jgi:hypothetical protein
VLEACHELDLALVALLRSDGPAPDIAEELKLYGQFLGDWNTDIITYTPDGARHEGKGEIHFEWILNGRAIQDVWMIPKLKDRRPDPPQMPVAGNWLGTTLRLYDPAIKGWRIYWLDPATNASNSRSVTGKDRISYRREPPRTARRRGGA